MNEWPPFVSLLLVGQRACSGTPIRIQDLHLTFTSIPNVKLLKTVVGGTMLRCSWSNPYPRALRSARALMTSQGFKEETCQLLVRLSRTSSKGRASLNNDSYQEGSNSICSEAHWFLQVSPKSSAVIIICLHLCKNWWRSLLNTQSFNWQRWTWKLSEQCSCEKLHDV